MTKEEVKQFIREKAYEKDPIRSLYDDLVAAFELDGTDARVSKMYTYAWEKGHSGGYMEVYYYFDDLVDIFKS